MGFRLITLDIDKSIYKDQGGKASLSAHLERSIILDMIAHLDTAGFKLEGGNDGDDEEDFTEPMKALDFFWDRVDYVHLHFRKEGFNLHTVMLVRGNGIDVISDWTYTNGDPDGFDAAVSAFCDTIEDGYPRQS